MNQVIGMSHVFARRLNRFAVAFLAFFAIGSAASAQQFAIGSYHLQGSVRVSATQYDYTYTADVTNSGAAAQNVVGTVVSSSPNTLVMKGSVNFGSVPASNTITSVDTFVIRQDRRFAFNPSSLTWTFTSAQKPTANAGPDQTAKIGATVTLNGTGSTDPNGNSLTYLWSLISAPPGSAARVDNPTSSMPTLTIDLAGNYVIQLVVNNGAANSNPADVTISTSQSASITATAGTPQSTGINTAFATNLSATVKDAGNNPLSGITVTFSAPGSGASGNFAGGVVTATTNASGVATAAVFTANATAGSYSVTASVSGVSTPASFSLTNTVGTPASITATAGTPQSTGINTAFATNLSATVKDAGNNPLSGITVTFSAPGSGASGSFAGGVVTATTNASGVATAAVFTANATAGSYSITATASGVSTPASFSLTNTVGTPASITATAGTPQSTGINTAFATNLSATVKDAGNNPLSGITVTFSAPGSGASGNFAGGVVTATTNASGVATAAVFTANATAGSYSITATASGVSTPASFSLTNTVGTPASITATAGTPQSTGINTAFATNLSATVKDAGNNPLSGITVTFSAPGSGASGNFAGGVVTATTNASGVATAAVFTANATAGSYSITATASGVSTPASFSLTNTVGTPASITATAGTPQSTGINTAFATNLSATVKDAGNNPLSGITVTFSAPGSGASGNFAGGVVTATTNASGVATAAVFTANATAGSYSITATASGVSTPASFSLTNTVGTPASITATAGTPQSTGINTAFATNLSATVKDAGNNPLSGITVTFSAPGSGASGSFAGGVVTATTNASGVATAAVFTANATAGSYSITATASGVSTPASFSLTNTVGTPASITATAGTPQSTGINTAFATNLSATVKDAGNNPLSGITVTFSAPGSGASGSFAGGVVTATTNASGVATAAVFTANATAGSYSITATASGVSTPASFSLTNTVGTPASITATAGTPQSTGINTAFATNLSATVKDAGNNPLSGITVTFSAPGSGASGNFAGGVVTATTNASGVATAAVFTANGTAGLYSVSAAAAGVGTPAIFSLNNLAGAASTIIATAGTPQSTTVNTVFGTTLQATVKDASSNPVSGVTVTFSVPGSGASGSFAGGVVFATTNVNGVATAVSFTANGTAGSYNVTASASGIGTPASFTLTNTAGTPASITATGGTPQSVAVNTVFPSSLQATVRDSGNNPVSGITVTFAAPGSAASGSFAGGVVTATTNASGVATAAVFTANGTAGSYNVTASASGVGTFASFALTNTPGIPASITATAGTPQSAVINNVFPTNLQATVRDSGNNPVSGVTVTFSAPGSGAGGSFAGGVVTATTNASGVATAAVFTANATGGSYSVTASVSGASTPASFSLTNTVGAPASITVTAGTPQSAAINTAFATNLQVTVKDGGNNPLSGVTVTFSAPGSGASGNFAGGVVTATTNASGVATAAVFTANATAGSYSVTASASGIGTPASFALTNTVGTPASITATAGTPQSTAINTAFATNLSATVKDAGNNPLSGITVTFAAPGSGASGSFAGGVVTATTNASGVATAAVFTANATAGSYSVTASASGVSTPASFALTNTAPTIQTLSINTNNLNFGSQNAGSTSTAQSISVTNTGSASVTFTSITLIGSNPSEFTIASNTCTGVLAVNTACTVSLTFTPAANGARSASVQFADSATGSPQTVLLTGTGQSATQNLVFNPESLVFGVDNVGTKTAATAVQIENVGTASVAIASVQITGPNASDFAVSSNSCTTLVENGVCNVGITFSPSAPGVRAANLQINDNAPGSPHNVPLIGTGQSVTQTVSQSVTDITYGATNVGATANSSFTLYSLGTGGAVLAAPVLGGANTGDFSITSNNCPVGPSTFNSGASCSISVSFTPTATGLRVATVTVTDNTPESPHVVMLTGTGQSVTQVSSQSVTNITYGVTNVAATSNNSFTLYDLGTGPITLGAATLSGANSGDFSITNNCPVGPSTLASGGSCSVSVSFTPTAGGVRTATVTVTDSTPESPHVVMLTGTGQSVTQVSSQSVTNITYGVTNVGATSNNSFTLYDLGTGPITLGAAALSGANPGDFSITSNSCPVSPATLASGGSCAISVSFKPTAAGIRTATVTVTDSTPESPHVVMLTGTGQSVTQSISFSVGTLAYGADTLGTSQSGSFSMYNLGTGPVTGSSYVLGGTNPGDFSISSNSCPVSPATLASGSSCSITILFTPTAAGVRTATVTVTDNASGSPQVINLVGTGQTAVQNLSFSVVNTDFGVEPVSFTTGATGISAYNIGDTALSFTSVAIAGANAADFSITSNGCTGSLAAGGTCSVSVNFTPSAVGVRTATLQYTDSVAGSPQSVTLTGVGETAVQTLSPSPQSLVFPSETVGSTSGGIDSFVTNAGDAPITFSGITLLGTNAGDFAIVNNSCPSSSSTLASGSQCFAVVTFKPTAVGLRTATVQYTSNASNSPVTVQLFGNGLPSGSAISFNPSDSNFSSANLGSSAGPQTITIQNISGSSLSLSGLALTGPNSADFTLGATTCGSSLSASGTCTQAVTFTPSGLGQRIAALQVTDNGPGSPQLGGLEGIGTTSAQVISTSAIALDLGIENTGTTSAQKAVTLTNSGTATTTLSSFTLGGADPGDFAISNNLCGATLTTGASCNVNMTFTPSASGVRTGTLQIADTATGSPQTVMLSGDGQIPGENLVVTTPTLAFGTQNDGTASSAQGAIVKSTGTAPVTFSSFTITGTNAADFAISFNNCTSSSSQLAQNTTCQVNIVFTPSSIGVETATLNFNDNAPGSPHTVSLTGVGQSSSASSENLVVTTPTLAFGTQNDGTASSAQGAIVKSTGTAPVTFSSFTITGTNAADFAISFNNCTSSSSQLAQNATCQVNITFTPSIVGAETATLNFNDNAPGSPHTVSLTGVGQSSSASSENLVVTTPTLAFGTQNDGTASSAQGAIVKSTGTAPVTFSSFTITGTNAADFAISFNNCTSSSSQLAQNTTCQVNIVFTPSSIGVETATLNFNDNAPGSPHTVSLTGVGQSSSASSENLVVTTPTLAFGTQNDGTASSAQGAIVKSTGTAPVTFSSFTITGTNAADFAISFNNCTSSSSQLAQNATCQVNITFTPSIVGAETATLNFNDNAPGSPHTVSLTGVGQSSSASSENLVVTTPTLAFGTQNDGTTSAQQAVIVKSTGTAPVTFSSFTITGTNAADFTISFNNCTSSSSQLVQNTTCQVNIVFTPSSIGVETATLNFNDNAPGSPHTVSLTGVGQAVTKTLAVTTPTLTYAAQTVGTTSGAQSASVLNTGTGAVTFTSYTITGANPGDFAIGSNQCQSSFTSQLPGSATCFVQVSFKPTATGTRTATLQFTSNALGSPQTVTLTGTGQ